MTKARVKAALDRMRKRMPIANYSEAAYEELGAPGAMLSGSKTAPEGETVYWNACIFNDAKEQIWHGDLNLTTSAEFLQRLANRVGRIHVTPEHPFRFDGFKRGKSERGDRIVTYEPAPSPTPQPEGEDRGGSR